ncbi:MAG TPA: sulfite exporter TauE/SafE family protein [Acidobacteriaceae bacterium]|nr:sulfite exporter TauE/SafE family protein [Acidobacteriaceae bacterium]
MAVSSIPASAAEALLLGLAAGPVCLASCGPVVLPWMLVQPRGVRVHARQMSIFLAARLAGYLLFASVIWTAGEALTRTWSDRTWLYGAVQVLLAGGLLVYAAARPNAHCALAGAPQALVQIGPASPTIPRPRASGALTLGFLTGINLCPPFLAAGVRAAQMRTLADALFFFALFFAGTAVWFMPFLSLAAVRRSPQFLTFARMVAVLLACWYGFAGASLLIEKAIYG